jgi:hypothetical protein
MDSEIFDIHKDLANPFSPLTLDCCYDMLDSFSDEDLGYFGSNPMNAYEIINTAFTIKG